MATIVPFVDLRSQHEEVRGEIEAAIAGLIDRSSFIGGEALTRFEGNFARYLGVKEVLGVANGTDALWLSLAALGVGARDAVITVPNTFIATVEAITRLGAYPLFVDIDLATATMDVELARQLLKQECRQEDDGRTMHLRTGRRVAALLPVHLYGLPANMPALIELAKEYDLPIVEDAAQAHGARCLLDGQWKRVGALGVAAGFSFYPAKNLGAMGDAGAVATNDPELAAKMRWLRDHGQSERYIHVTAEGWNSRLDAIQAAVLDIKLKHLDRWNAARRVAAAHYRKAMEALPLVLPVEPPYAEPIYQVFVVRAPDRDLLKRELEVRGIGTGLHYPVPLHLQQAYRHLGLGPGSFPNAEESARTVLSLPMHPGLKPAQIEQVAQACREILG